MSNKLVIKSQVFFGLSLILSLNLSSIAFGKETARDYEIDSSHSTVGFTVSHFLSEVDGRFKNYDGTFSFDASKPENSKITVQIKADSINTDEAKRDEHLRGEDIFDVKKYPTLKFVSHKITPSGEKNYQVLGDLTMRGVTKPVTLEMKYLGEIDDPWGNHRASFKGTTEISRKDYGMKWNKALDKGGFVLGDNIVVNLKIEAIEKKKSAK